jgi:hypothetical protein
VSVVCRVRPSREFAPAGDLLFERPKSRQKVAPVPSPLFEGCPAMLEAQGRAELASLRSAQTGGAKSVLDARFARALGSCASRLLQRGVKEQPEQPPASGRNLAATRARRPVVGVRLPPLSTAEERKSRSPRAKLASSTDSRRLFEQSVATRVRRGASGLSGLGNPAGAVRPGAPSLPTFLCAQESRSPAGAKSRHHSWQYAKGATP